MDRDNYIVIQGWMVTELGLKGNELLVYALIYGFSQTKGQVFNGSLQYLADWTNSTKQGVLKNLKSLVEKGLVEKKETILNGVKSCEYYSTKFNGVKQSLIGGIKQSLTGGIKQSLTNNIEIDNIDRDNIERKNIKKEDFEKNNKEDKQSDLQKIEERKKPSEKVLKEEFEEVWRQYPKREGKANAFKSYIKARKEGVPREEIEAGIERYIDMLKIRGTEVQYIKMGSTWFNQRGWEDEYSKPARKVIGTGTTNENDEITDSEPLF